MPLAQGLGDFLAGPSLSLALPWQDLAKLARPREGRREGESALHPLNHSGEGGSGGDQTVASLGLGRAGAEAGRQ